MLQQISATFSFDKLLSSFIKIYSIIIIIYKVLQKVQSILSFYLYQRHQYYFYYNFWSLKSMTKINEEIPLVQDRIQNRLINHQSSSSQGMKEGNSQDGRTRSTLLEQDTEDKNNKRKAKNAGKTFKRLFGYSWKNKSLLFIANFALVISSFGFVLLPLLCGQMIDTIRQEGDLLVGAIKFIILTIMMAVFSSIRGFSFNLLGQKIMVEMRQELFDRLLQKDISYYDQNKTGQLLSRLGNDITTVYSVCSDNLSMLIRNLLQFLGSLIFLWLISWKLTLFIIVLTPIISFGVLIVIKKMKKFQKEYQNNVALTTSLATQVFGNIRVVRSFANQKLQSRNYDSLLNKVYTIGRKKHFYYGIMLLITTVFANVLVLTILYFGGNLVIEGDLSIGDLTSFVLYTITLTIGFASISGILNQTVSAIGICEHIFEIMDEPVKIMAGAMIPELKYQTGNIIQFVDASFSYPSKPTVQVLKKVNLKIKFGESVAIVGPSGSGKSSIVSLILRFYDLNEGQILINGCNIKDLDTDKLRQQIGFVSQEPTLFSGSLRQNIEYGLKNTNRKQQIVATSLEIANAKEFVYNQQLFPEKLDTLVGQRGVKLSGGQKQRIAIARCVAKQPQVMIFDEATSALDAQSEYQVQKAIDALVGKRDRTMIIVAHRLSTIINCDRIIVIKNGQIAEQGSHKVLLSRNGVYAHLVQRQLAKHD